LNAPPPGWGMKAVRSRGVDVTDAGIDVKPGEDLTTIEIEPTKVSALPSGEYFAYAIDLNSARQHKPGDLLEDTVIENAEP
jgi:hypothetical protein